MPGEEKDLDVVLARVNQLEDRLRRMRRAQGAAMWSGGAVLVILGMLPMLLASRAAGPEKELRASRFVLVDEKGVERGEFGFSPAGAARLLIHGKKSGKGMLMFVDDDEGTANIIMYGRNKTTRLGIGIRKTGQAFLELWDKDGKAHIGLGVDKKHGAVIKLTDRSRKTRVRLVARESGSSGIALLDQGGLGRGAFVIDDAGRTLFVMQDLEGNPRVAISTEKDGSSPTIGIVGKKGQASLSLMLLKDRSPTLFVTDKNGKERLILGVDDVSAKLLLKDKEEETIWTAP